MKYQRSLCHALTWVGGGELRHRARPFEHDHFVTGRLCKSRCETQVIHDQFVTRVAITLSRGRAPMRDHFVTQSYS